MSTQHTHTHILVFYLVSHHLEADLQMMSSLCSAYVNKARFPPNHDFFHDSHQHHKRSELSTWEWKGQFTSDMTRGIS